MDVDDNTGVVKEADVSPLGCTVVGGMADELTEDLSVGVRESEDASAVGTIGSVVTYNGTVMSCRLTRLERN